MPSPVRSLRALVDRFEDRGVYIPGDKAYSTPRWREAGWTLVALLLAVALFAVFFTFAL